MPNLIDIGINPFSAADAVFDISGDQERADQAQAASEQQRYLDNQYRTRRDIVADTRYSEERMREDNRLQRLGLDAKKAGISLNAALGGAGYTPANIQIRGQGGRAAGTYQRGSSASLINAAQLRTQLRVQRAQAKKVEAEATSAQADALVKIGVIPPYDPPTITELPPVPKMKSAKQYYYDHNTGKTINWLDPDLAESLDSIGSWFYMGINEWEKNLRDFWQQSKQYRHQRNYGR